MYLGNFIKKLNKEHQKVYFSGIAFNSAQVRKNYIFFAIKGNKFDGNDYIQDAIKKGAKVIVSEKKTKLQNKGIIYLKSKNSRKLLSELSYKFIKKHVKKLIAVTGTNGKSSVADFYYQILNLSKKRAASIGTIGVQSKNKKKEVENTTLNPIKLSKIINRLNLKKIDHIILEASSHGLKQNRLDGLLFDLGIFTNLSHDHLDYHKNFRNYLNSKLYLFKYLVKKGGHVILDSTIPQFREIKKISIQKKLKLETVFGKNSDLELVAHTYKNEHQNLKIRYKSQVFEITLNLIGKIQIKNILMAILAAIKSKLEIGVIIKIMSKIKSVEGRLEKIGVLRNKSKVILDYAHTPDALETVLINIKEQFPLSKIHLTFGCGGDRDKDKRFKMGKIASKYADKIYLTDDNPRSESPQKIRNEIKKGIKNKNVEEISERKKAILKCINSLCSGDIAIIAGKGHEKTQDYKGKKKYFSDRKEILKSILKKNRSLFKDIRLNIIQEKNKILPNNINFNKACIDSKKIKKNDIFFAIKGKKNDGNKFVAQAFSKKASLVIVNKFNKKNNIKLQIKTNDTLKFLTESSKIFRENINTKIIAITGSCGKTTLKELLGSSLNKVSKVSISPKSYNNKYGVPLSLLNLRQRDNYGVLELGMDRKGEIDYLSKIVQPDVSVITNVNYAHAKNFKNLKQIALAKSEIINNTKDNGFIILNADDNFFTLHKKIAEQKNIKILSFGIKSKKSNVKLTSIQKIGKKFKANIKINNLKTNFLIPNDFQSNILNFLATLTVMNIFFDISKINKNIFINFKTPNGRGDISKIKIKNKKLNLIDESYNSNPLSLKSAILNFDKLESKKSKKYLLLGDMLELGKHSKKLHKSISKTINRTKIDKVFVKGNKILSTFNSILKSKRGRILKNNSQIIDLIKNDLNNNDYLMIKASNATGFNSVTKNLKGLK
ncbi:UDP-N-acetylmuramoyl-L-alanyl-D-glutamate--2,6-diaminopimelate ligase [Candidatus Pelagibacter sp.]|nr:UDP-N-acetylmuramoyl-L-alanyl-D-glutamate--2,6-diaminopimelate ligase [Candidatus Pelagibacter sp.]